MADEETTENKTVTIKIDDTAATNRFAGNRVPVSVNGTIAHIPFNEETEVGEHIIGALTDAGIPFTVVGSKDSAGSVAEGVSVTDPLALTVPADDPAKGEGEGEDHARQAPEELKNDPGTVHVEADIATNELTTGKDGGGSTAGQTAGDTGGANANGTAGDKPQPNETAKTADDSGEKSEPMLEQSIPDLTEALKGVTDVAEIDRLIAAENAAKSRKTRAGAISALEARKAELTAA